VADWDAARYDRVSDPQVEWGRRVLARLAPRPGERILDLGCGTGRLTQELAASARGGVVTGVDLSAAMLVVASRSAPETGDQGAGRMRWVRGDGAALPFLASFDAVFSTATLHWIPDHAAVFRGVRQALNPGGRFVAQCGGGRNLERLYTRAAGLMSDPRFARCFPGWRDPWNFALPDPTRAALDDNGFDAVDVWLEASPVTFADAETYAEFVSCVCLRHHLERLPPELRDPFVEALAGQAAHDDPPFTLDYWRLNIDARRPA
jgi:trans-aconitate 2-methyltransferase